MRHPVLCLVVVVAAASLLMLPLSAHHEITAKFDPAKTTRLQGIVTYVDWANPHVHVFMNVGTGSNRVNLVVAVQSVIGLQHANCTPDAAKPGESATLDGILG